MRSCRKPDAQKFVQVSSSIRNRIQEKESELEKELLERETKRQKTQDHF